MAVLKYGEYGDAADPCLLRDKEAIMGLKDGTGAPRITRIGVRTRK
jgi:hypothetical protein